MGFKKNYPIKQQPVGVCDAIYLKWIGKRDGSKSLPRKSEEGIWMSPFIDKQMHDYQEQCSVAWETLQIRQEDEWVKLSEMVDSLTDKKKQLDFAIENLSSLLRQKDAAESDRKHGEKKLNDAQVKARRMREKNQRLSVYRNRVNMVSKEYEDQLKEVSTTFCKVTEQIYSTKMACNRMKEHLYKRLDVYWNAALTNHNQKETMLTVPYVEISVNSETDYMQLHSQLIQRIKGLKEENENENVSKK